MAKTVVVVGGGIGGLAAAAGLHRRGWSVRVLEQAPEFTEVGAGISLWPNAFRALAAIGVGSEVGQGKLGAVGGLRDWRGRWIVRMDDDPTAAAHAAGAVVAHRAELLSALLAGVPAECRQAGVRVSGVRLSGGRAVVEHDQGEVAADLVVGADGLRSVVRAARWPDAHQPRYSGRTVWRLVLRRPPGLDGAKTAETWGPGSVFGMFPMPDDRVYCYGTATVPAGGAAPDELAEVRRRFGDWCDPIPAVLAAARQEEVLRNDLYYLPPLRGYVSGPVVLLGDAAHAMTPNLGQGGCQALEDAAVLALALDATPDLATALRQYDRLRRPRTQAIARKSRLSGSVAQLTWAPARAARDAALRTMPRSIFMKSVAAPLDWHPTAT